MKKTAFYLILLLSLIHVISCAPIVQHADPFYNVNDDFSMSRIPLIKPIEANQLDGSSPWHLELNNALWIKLPKSQEQDVAAYYGYSNVEELEKFAIKDGVIMAYSAYVDKDAEPFIQESYFHWFVIIPEKEISEGFQTEDAFHEYIQSLGVGDLDWQTPDEAYEQFKLTGCLEWIPDCE